MILFASFVDIDAMTSTSDEEIILKSDTIGRVRMPKDKRELILDRFEESGMTGLAFAKHVGVKYPTFASWIQKRRRDREERPASGPKEAQTSISLFEAVLDQHPISTACGLELISVGGTRIRLERSEQIPMAVTLLRQLGDAKL